MSTLTNNLIQLKTLYAYGDKLYEIARQIPLHNFYRKDGSMISEYFNAWKSHLGADHVLKTQTHFIFCKTIEDAEIISEENC